VGLGVGSKAKTLEAWESMQHGYKERKEFVP